MKVLLTFKTFPEQRQLLEQLFEKKSELIFLKDHPVEMKEEWVKMKEQVWKMRQHDLSAYG